MNGFYPVLNEIHDKAAKELPLAELALFEHIWRKLIGWGKFDDSISITQLVEETTASRMTVIRLVKKLETKRWIVVERVEGITNNIAIPECPGIKMRLVPYQNGTGTSTKMRPGTSTKLGHTTDSSSTDSLKTPTTEEVVADNVPEKGKDSPNNSQLPNGMDAREFYKLIEFKVGVVKKGMDGHKEMVDYLTTQPEDRLRTVVKHAVSDNTAPRFGLEYIYEKCDQWDYWSGKWMLAPGEKEDANLKLMKEEEATFRAEGMDYQADKMVEAIKIAEGG